MSSDILRTHSQTLRSHLKYETLLWFFGREGVGDVRQLNPPAKPFHSLSLADGRYPWKHVTTRLLRDRVTQIAVDGAVNFVFYAVRKTAPSLLKDTTVWIIRAIPVWHSKWVESGHYFLRITRHLLHYTNPPDGALQFLFIYFQARRREYIIPTYREYFRLENINGSLYEFWWKTICQRHCFHTFIL